MRLALGAHRHEYISCHLRDLGSRMVIAGAGWPPYNPGTGPVSDLPVVGNVPLTGGALDAHTPLPANADG